MGSLRRLGVASSFVLLATLASRPSQAQTSAVAQSLFDAGRQLLSEGKVHEACQKFDESNRADPALGTLLNLAACHEREGKTATAWTEFKDAEGQAMRASDATRQSYAHAHVQSLEAQLHRVVIEVLSRPDGMVVKLDGEVLGPAAWGTAIPLDPGQHEIEVSVPGKPTWKRTVVAGPGAGTDRVEVPALDQPAPPTPPTQPPPGTGPETSSVPPPAPSSSPAPAPAPASPPETTPATTPDSSASMDSGASHGSGANGKRIAGFVVGGAGIVAIGVGTVFGIMAGSKASDRDALCAPGTPCTVQHAFDLDHDARIDQQVAIISIIGGVLAAGAGTYLVLTSKPAATGAASIHVTPLVGRAGGGLAAFGAF